VRYQQPECVSPETCLRHQEGQQQDVEFDGGILEHATASGLQGSGGHRIGHLALGTQNPTEVVLHFDASTSALLELLLEELHRHASRITLILRIAVLEDEAVLGGRRDRGYE
jgi:hypothetical protein